MNKVIALLTFVFLAATAMADSVDDLVNRAENGLSKTSLLEARFHQKVTLPFMDVALESDGKFCFDIRDRHNPEIFWEYQKPDVSGFLYQDGKAKFWSKQGQKTLSDSEMGFLKSMTSQILQWISFEPDKLKEIYNISPGPEPLSLKFTPKESSRLFSAIILTLSEDMTRLRQLAFQGKNGELTTISFAVEAMNQPLSGACSKK